LRFGVPEGRPRRICVMVASRANYARVKSVLRAIEEHPALELQLVVGASALLNRFGSAIDVIRSDGFEPAAITYTIIEGENPTTMAKSTGLGIIELSTIFENLRPDIVVTVADRFETMATAVAASYMNIPLAHTQGGEVTGNIDESVRHAITKLAHIHFPATEESRERVIRMGEDPETVFNTGCPAIDAITNIDLGLKNDLFTRYGGLGPGLDVEGKPYLLVLQHPVTTEFGSGREQIEETLKALKLLGMQAIMLWPNIDAGSDDVAKGIRKRHPNAQIIFATEEPEVRSAREAIHLHAFDYLAKPVSKEQIIDSVIPRPSARCSLGRVYVRLHAGSPPTPHC
jgi:UDP-hydrolysing UDP-N-acetyl-D-glucosamine 2-epimerase